MEPILERKDLAHLESQVIQCKCGGVIAACRTPECYQETDWMKDLRKYAKKGYTIQTLSHDKWQWGCKCKAIAEAAEQQADAMAPKLF